MPRDSSLRTNRDLYLFVAELCQLRGEHDRPLEEYLRTLLQLAEEHREAPGLSLATFAHLLEAAFVGNVPPADGAVSQERSAGGGLTGYAGWRETLLLQVADLHEMAKTGILSHPHRYLGIDAPGGMPWYNFDPLTYLECAVDGTFGGWRSGDPTGRAYVPGLVAVIDADGTLRAVAPDELDDPIVEIEAISWDTLTDFLEAGRCYE
jgi:hypothetical protein